MNKLDINNESSSPSPDGPSAARPLHERHQSLSSLPDVVGVVFLEIVCAIDLPAEKNGKSFI
jgi:hypothetical protein